MLSQFSHSESQRVWLFWELTLKVLNWILCSMTSSRVRFRMLELIVFGWFDEISLRLLLLSYASCNLGSNESNLFGVNLIFENSNWSFSSQEFVLVYYLQIFYENHLVRWIRIERNDCSLKQVYEFTYCTVIILTITIFFSFHMLLLLHFFWFSFFL